jgi:HD-GYP domain-containing protein (c-di-GMP phosphodiesterase class II)
MRDQTDLIDQRRRRHQALLETIEAFIYAVERRDPFLLGHTRRVRRYAIAIGRNLGLDNDNLTGLALAASLSQIGKIFIPDAILTKADRHDQQEAEIMRRHINHAIGILGRIDFGYPVVDILSQMHERLDGSGYPEGRSDDEIDRRGRILGAADVFCARTAPRSYRRRLSAGKALYHLANNARRYDITVIAALAEIVGKEGGLASTDDLDDSLLDSRIWSDLQNADRPAAGAAV